MDRMYDDYCRGLFDVAKGIEQKPFYCERVNMTIPAVFCHWNCWGDWRKWRKEDTEVLRKKYFPPLTEEEKANQDLVSVLIPCHITDKKYLDRTVQAVKDTAVGPIEILKEIDDSYKGQRVLLNELARKAKGKYLFRLDAHCNLTEGWDAKMKAVCDDNTIVTVIFDGLNPETWQGTNRDNGFVRISQHLETRFVRGWKAIEEREVVEETMGLSGTAFMVPKDYYWKMGGCDESLGEYGNIGAEWACKTWLTGGRCIIRTDVVCYHLFRKMAPFDIPMGEKERAAKKLYEQWVLGKDPRIKKPMGWLVQKFSHYLKNMVYKQF